MKNKILFVLFTAVFSATSPASTDEYVLEEAYKKGSWDWVFSWLTERAKAYADKRRAVPEQDALVLLGSYRPKLADGVFDWELGVCKHDKRAKWLAPWVNTEGKISDGTLYSMYPRIEDIPVKKYTVSKGVPFELESKNYKRAGAKRFASFKYSWFISSNSKMDLIQNESRHDYNYSHVFNSYGDYTLLGVVYSDYELGFSINFNFDHDGAGNYSYDGTKFKPTWGKDMGLYGCGGAIVKVVKNTRPIINGLSISHMRWSDTSFVWAIDVDVKDEHTNKDNLFYEFELFKNGKRITHSKGARIVVPEFLINPQYRELYTYKLVVSDGDMATIKQGGLFD